MELQPILDPLRELSTVATQLEPVVNGIVLIVALVIFVIAFLAYRRTESRKLLLVSLFFLLFVIKYVLATIDLFLSPGYFFPAASQHVIELVALVLLFFAIFRK